MEVVLSKATSDCVCLSADPQARIPNIQNNPPQRASFSHIIDAAVDRSRAPSEPTKTVRYFHTTASLCLIPWEGKGFLLSKGYNFSCSSITTDPSVVEPSALIAFDKSRPKCLARKGYRARRLLSS